MSAKKVVKNVVKKPAEVKEDVKKPVAAKKEAPAYVNELEALKAAATEMNTVMGLNPPIDVEEKDAKKLAAAIVKDSQEITSTGDKGYKPAPDVTPDYDVETKKCSYSPAVMDTIASLPGAKAPWRAVKAVGSVDKSPDKKPGMKKEGVVAAIDAFTSKKGKTVAEVLAYMVEKFPNRASSSMKNTIGGRMRKANGYKIEEGKNGKIYTYMGK